MKNIWGIYSNDLRKTTTNWVASILVGGLILLPSLYAWFNIQASIDPYGNTKNILVGVVNEDRGAEINGVQMNAGEEIVKELKNNKDLGWQFVDKNNGMEKVLSGEYFATIIIPREFSKNLATIVNDKQQQAKIEYYENDKKNAIAPKITSKGASAIAEQVSNKFVATVNGVIFDLFNQIGIELENRLPAIKQFEEFIFKLQKKLPEVKALLNQSMSYAEGADDILGKVQQAVPKVEAIANEGMGIINKANQVISNAEADIDTFKPNIQKDIQTLKTVTDSAKTKINQLQAMEMDPQKLQMIVEEIDPLLKKGEEVTRNVQRKLNEALNIAQNNDANEKVKNDLQQHLNHLSQILTNFENVEGAFEELQTLIANGKVPSQDQLNRFKFAISNVQQLVNQISEADKQKIESFINEEVLKTKQTLQNAKGILEELSVTLPSISNALNNAAGTLHKGEEVLQNANKQYPMIANKVDEVADTIERLQKETNLNEIIDILRNNPNSESSFLANPVKIENNLLFSLPNYGSGMNPFYTVLAIWVGCLLLISLLSVDPAHYEEYTSHEIYFGRLLTFWTFSFLQTLIVTLGDIFILKDIYIHSPGWFLLFGLLSSFVFILIVFTLVSIFGNVGKAMAIVLLVLQIAGAGGTYPVQLIPRFFQMINPFLPFTYSIDLMREAVGGIVWENVRTDIIFLLIFAAIAILLGVFLKEPINRITYKLRKKSNESGIFH
ncbi:YhgE/Pip domain-containing protein [Cytobacillus massiliigabonensis]|uniref:YhgE/Pip domain-containing protein n=1 Tax=Cytobacillus massiliigabonensis TaxID=1871011 RepID=UPI000C86693F|nr:YhgE/Pip domain-containing protein [Cytobacillus massiliigabonensis]